MEYPRLNPIEVFPLEHEGQKLMCLRDPSNSDSNPIYINPEALIVLRLFDGKHSFEDIQSDIKQQYGELIPREELTMLVKQLDEALLLNTERFRQHKRKAEAEFLQSSLRESPHAGLSYPDNANELGEWIDGFFKLAEELNPRKPCSDKVKGIVSPHIDFTRGGKSYALAYRELQDSEADTYFIFGTSHYAEVENPFILTKKNFVTPFGEAQTDIAILDSITTECDWNLFEGEISHKAEHSIEFQVAFLQHVLKDRQEFKIVPILCNSFYKILRDGKSPVEDKKISKFLDTASDIVSNLGDRSFIIAGADMAHVGPKFGDPARVDEPKLNEIREQDNLSLSFSERMDAEGFYRSVEEEKDWRKICGLSPIYATLMVINAQRGELLDYDQALEPDTGSVVSFASVGFYD